MQNFIKSSHNFIFFFRLTAFSFILAAYLILQISVKIIFLFNSQLPSFILKRKLALLTLKIFDVEMEINGEQSSKGCFIAANHSSTLDIPLLLQVTYPIFITSVEVKESFLTGIITKLSDTIFVERRRKSSVIKDNRHIAGIIENGTSVCIFPEGTSSDGTEILKFKSSLFQSVAYSGIKVQPVCIKYDYSPQFKNHEKVGYYGDMTFLRHICNLCLSGKIKVRMDFCEKVSTEGKNRKEICGITEVRIREKFSN